MRVLNAIMSAHWAMESTALETLHEIASRENVVSPEALESYRSQTHDRGEKMKIRDGVAIIDIKGPLFKYANIFTAISGATSYDVVMRDLQTAINDPQVQAVLITVDSPGGEANGCDELGAAIYEARQKKPITAFVSGMACSGGYWIASAAERVVVSDMAILGSIGVVVGITSRKKAEEARGITSFQFVSSHSPHKRPDPETEKGAAKIQQMVDDLAEVFVGAVAKHRSVSAEDVVSKFGAGGVEVGAKAVALGMADQVGQFEATLASLSKRGTNRRNQQRSTGGFAMSNQSNNAAAENENADIAKVQADAANKATADTKNRIKAIVASEEGKAMPTLAEHFAYNTDVSAEDAVAAMKAAKTDMDAGKAGDQGNNQASRGSYEDDKREAGALGLGAPEGRGERGAGDAKAGWSKAVANANARFDQFAG